MLEPLGIPADAEALYVVLASLDGADPRRAGRARSGTAGGRGPHPPGRPWPTSASRVADRRRPLARAAARRRGQGPAGPPAGRDRGRGDRRRDTLQNQLLAASHNSEDDIQVFVGREAVVPRTAAVRRDHHARSACSTSRPYVEQRAVDGVAGGPPRGRPRVAGAGARGRRCAASTTPVSTRAAAGAGALRRQGRAGRGPASGPDEAGAVRRPDRLDPLDAVLHARPRDRRVGRAPPADRGVAALALQGGLGHARSRSPPAPTSTATRAGRCSSR